MKLLATYWRLVLTSFIQHRLGRSQHRKVTVVLGYEIAYTTLPVLITLFEEIFIEGAYYFQSHEQHPEIFDCGSNIGISVVYFKMLYPGSVITAFEPDSTSLSLLEKNVLRNQLAHVTVIDEALGKEKGERLLHTPIAGDPSLNKTLLHTTRKSRSIPVKVNRLSTFITSPVECVKIDIEGAEEEVLHDLIQSNKLDLVRCMVIEYHHDKTTASRDAFIRKIEDAGFAVTIRKALSTESILVCERK